MPSEKNPEKKILVLCPHPVGYAPGQRLRYEQYLDSFREAGYKVQVSPFMTEGFQKMVYKKGRNIEKIFWTLFGYLKRFLNLFTLPRYDVVYVFLWVTPFGLPLFERITRVLSKKIIYDIDDLIYSKTKSKANPVISGIKGRNKPLYLFRKADHVITSTITIGEFARQYNNHVSIIPVSVNTKIFIPKSDYAVNGKLVVGWSGSLSTSPYMHLLDDMLCELKNDLDFRLVILGDPGFHIEGLDIESWAWSKEKEVPVIRGFDIGLYPLPDEQWVYGKGGGKALQYMALGVPTIATAIGMNFKIIRDGENGFLVKTKEEWIQAIKQLSASQQLREKIGKNAVETVAGSYSVEANEEFYLAILNRLARG